MALLVDLPMGKNRGGRPPKEAGEQGTKQIRVYTDLAEKVTDLADLFGKSTASILDPIARDEIQELWEQHRAEIEEMKRLMQEQEQIRARVAQKDAKRRSR